jgi:hypothetical protein
MNNFDFQNNLPFTDNTVVRFENSIASRQLNIARDLFMFEQFLTALSQKITDDKDFQKQWFAEGVSCSALIPGQDWKTGKMRIKIEFIPDVPEQPESELQAETSSPLDDIRQTLNLNP